MPDWLPKAVGVRTVLPSPFFKGMLIVTEPVAVGCWEVVCVPAVLALPLLLLPPLPSPPQAATQSNAARDR
ncbi:hypothetical protein D769_06356 [Cupriavidus sp. HMR-1]|nr:hypothetical protein D769_06356 [Cupriavidus sp. HMR-1]